MAMDDVYRLVKAILIDGQIHQPARVRDLVPKGPWKKATVLDASVSYMGSGMYNGHVRYVLDGEKLAHDATFHQLWLDGWTDYDLRMGVEQARRNARRTLKPTMSPIYVVRYADGRDSVDTEPVTDEVWETILKGGVRCREDSYAYVETTRQPSKKRRRKGR